MSNKPSHVLVPTDFSDTAQAALNYALDLCEREGARLTLLHVTNRRKAEESLMGFDSLHYLFRATSEDWLKDAKNRSGVRWEALQELAHKEMEQSVGEQWKGRVDVHLDTAEGYPSEAILNYVKEKGVDLVVMGTRGRGHAKQLVMGSVTQNVIRQAECPVLTVNNLAGRAGSSESAEAATA
jgi:nucleotide-binding universal stress UspA family protein